MKQKERMTICMISMLVLLCGAVLAASAAQITVMPQTQTVSKGDNFTVDIYVDPEGNMTAGVDYVLRFDNTLLNATLLTRGSFFSGDTWIHKEINNTAGTIDYGETLLGGGGVTNPDTLATITFQAIAEETGVSELSFETVTLCDPDGGRIPTTRNDGNVSVIAGIPGDVDGLPGITTNDGRQIFMYLLHGAEEYPLQDLWAADCDGLCDGITTNDGRQIFMYLLHGAEEYPLNCSC